MKTAKANGIPVPDRTVFNSMYDKENGIARKALTEDEFEKKRQAALSMLENCINGKI